jgi:hypothetical protein
MRGVLPEAIRRRTWKADFSHLVNEGMARDFPQVVRCLESGSLAVRLGYLEGGLLGDELNLLKGRMRGPDCETAWGLSDLLGLERWLQVFFGGSTTDPEVLGLPECSERPTAPGGTG